jgi:hypothetical protein
MEVAGAPPVDATDALHEVKTPVQRAIREMVFEVQSLFAMVYVL